MKKLGSYGFRRLSYHWMKSYLSNRAQAVSLSNCLSSQKEIFYEVPQGFTVDPFNFSCTEILFLQIFTIKQ